MGPLGYIVATVVVLVGGGAVIRYVRKHRHAAACPSVGVVTKAVTDTEGNVLSIAAAQAQANAWEAQGCQPAADALRAMITTRQIKEKAVADAAILVPAVVNWIPGCTPPAGFSPPSDWTPGVVPTGTIPGWTAPSGWRVGDPLPVGWACPSGWTKIAVPTDGAVASDYSASTSTTLGAQRRHPMLARRR